MSQASKILAVLIFWGILGMTWALLDENVIGKIPIMFPEPVAQDLEAWTIMGFIWKMSIIGLGIGSAVSILGDRGIVGIIVSGVMIFGGMFMLIFLWAAFWNVANVTIPNSFASGFNTVTNQKANLGVYDAAFEICMFGLALVSLLLGGTARIGSSRHHSRGIHYSAPSIKIKKIKPPKTNYRPTQFRNVGAQTAVYRGNNELIGFRHEP